MSKQLTVRELLDKKRDHGLAEAERWANSFRGECRSPDCPHTAEEHYLARLHLAGCYLDALAELRARRSADLSKEDVEALLYLKCFAEEAHEAAAALHGMEREHIAMTERALSLLARLLAAAEGEV